MNTQPIGDQGPSAEQIDALRAYRDRHGRRWKSRLLAEWLSSTGAMKGRSFAKSATPSARPGC